MRRLALLSATFCSVFVTLFFVAGVALAEAAVTKNVTSESELTAAINEAKADATAANPYTITLAGNITATKVVSVPSYTTFDLGGKTLTYSGSGDYAVAISGAATTGVTVKNGTVKNGGVHAYNSAALLTISGMTISNAPGFAINIREGAKVEGAIANNKIDGAKVGIWVYQGALVGDITNNTINDCSYRGISLSGNSDDPKGCSAGNITGNTIKNCKSDGIGIYAGSHAGDISGNTFTNIGGYHPASKLGEDYGIIINAGAGKGQETYCGSITNNTFTNMSYTAVAVYSGTDEATNYKASIKGDISGNTMTKIGTLEGVNLATCTQSAVYVDHWATVTGNISNNKIDDVRENGIYAHKNSVVGGNINDNTISNAKKAGICAYANSQIKGDISNNTVTDPGSYGIYISDSSEVSGTISNNTIKTPGSDGIRISTSKANAIEQNKVENAGKNGVSVASGSTVTSINKNTISLNSPKGGNAITVTEKSTATNITGNNISGKMNIAIKVDEPNGKTTITSNKITTSNSSKQSFRGIYVNEAKNNQATIQKNTITGNKSSYGVYVAMSKAVITGNTVSKSSFPVCYVQNKYKMKVSKNKYKANKKNKTSVLYNIKSAKLSKTKYVYNKKVNTPTLSAVKGYKNNKTLKKGTEYTVSLSKGRKNVGIYKYTLTGKGIYTGTFVKKFTIVPQKAAVKSAKAGAQKITVTAKKAAKAYGGSQLLIRYKVAGGSWRYATTSAAKKVISGLESGKKYTVSVCAQKKSGSTWIKGAWSSNKTVKVK